MNTFRNRIEAELKGLEYKSEFDIKMDEIRQMKREYRQSQYNSDGCKSIDANKIIEFARNRRKNTEWEDFWNSRAAAQSLYASLAKEVEYAKMINDENNEIVKYHNEEYLIKVNDVISAVIRMNKEKYNKYNK